MSVCDTSLSSGNLRITSKSISRTPGVRLSSVSRSKAAHVQQKKVTGGRFHTSLRKLCLRRSTEQEGGDTLDALISFFLTGSLEWVSTSISKLQQMVDLPK